MLSAGQMSRQFLWESLCGVEMNRFYSLWKHGTGCPTRVCSWRGWPPWTTLWGLAQQCEIKRGGGGHRRGAWRGSEDETDWEGEAAVKLHKVKGLKHQMERNLWRRGGTNTVRRQPANHSPAEPTRASTNVMSLKANWGSKLAIVKNKKSYTFQQSICYCKVSKYPFIWKTGSQSIAQFTKCEI